MSIFDLTLIVGGFIALAFGLWLGGVCYGYHLHQDRLQRLEKARKELRDRVFNQARKRTNTKEQGK